MDNETKALIGNYENRVSHLLDEFDREERKFHDFEKCLCVLIKSVLASSNVKIHDVTSRTKSRDSFAKKVRKPAKTYTKLSEITDFCGVRITTYFEDGVDTVKAIIEEQFVIDKDNSVDKRKLHDPDRFGYMSLHYVVALNEARANLIEYKQFRGMKAEIQIRSILQHTWAEIEHDLGYKSKITIPTDLQRRFSQLSSLLELADREFLDISNRMVKYENEVLKYLNAEQSEYLVDKNSLKIFALHHETVIEKDKSICKITMAELSFNEDFIENIAEMLKDVGVERLSELKLQLELFKNQIMPFANTWITQRQYKEFNNGISLMYLAYLILGKTKNQGEINLFAEKFRRGKHIENFGEHLIHICSSLET